MVSPFRLSNRNQASLDRAGRGPPQQHPSPTSNHTLINIMRPHSNTVRYLNTHCPLQPGTSATPEPENYTNSTIYPTTTNPIHIPICSHTLIHIYTHSRYLLLFFVFSVFIRRLTTTTSFLFSVQSLALARRCEFQHRMPELIAMTDMGIAGHSTQCKW